MTPAGGVHLFRQTLLCLNFQKETGRLFASLLMRVVVIVNQLNAQGAPRPQGSCIKSLSGSRSRRQSALFRTA